MIFVWSFTGEKTFSIKREKV